MGLIQADRFGAVVSAIRDACAGGELSRSLPWLFPWGFGAKMSENTAPPIMLSPAAERMRRHRQRRRKGLRSVWVDIRESEIDELIRRGHLANTDRDDRYAVRRAPHPFFDLSLRASFHAIQNAPC